LHIVYHCVTGCHTSSTAAAIHLGLLPIDYKPSYHDLIRVPFYDALEEKDRGKLMLRGTDEKGNKVYTLSRKYIPHLLLPVVSDTWRMLGQAEDELILINTQPSANGFVKFGGYLSRRLKLTGVGRPVVAKATLYSYNNIAKIVKNTKRSFS